jgi:hypothetical protein
MLMRLPIRFAALFLFVLIARVRSPRPRLRTKYMMLAIRNAVIGSLSFRKVYQRRPKESRKSSTSVVIFGGALITPSVSIL